MLSTGSLSIKNVMASSYLSMVEHFTDSSGNGGLPEAMSTLDQVSWDNGNQGFNHVDKEGGANFSGWELDREKLDQNVNIAPTLDQQPREITRKLKKVEDSVLNDNQSYCNTIGLKLFDGLHECIFNALRSFAEIEHRNSLIILNNQTETKKWIFERFIRKHIELVNLLLLKDIDQHSELQVYKTLLSTTYDTPLHQSKYILNDLTNYTTQYNCLKTIRFPTPASPPTHTALIKSHFSNDHLLKHVTRLTRSHCPDLLNRDTRTYDTHTHVHAGGRQRRRIPHGRRVARQTRRL